MANNISKYIALNSYILLEYEHNKEETLTQLTSNGIESWVTDTIFDKKLYFNQWSEGYLNNDLHLNSVATDEKNSSWYINADNTTSYWDYYADPSTVAQPSYQFDTVKIHIISGYNFDDIAGLLLQIKAEDTSSNLVSLSNFTWINQVTGDDVQKFSTNNLYLAGKYYDKYLELKVPSVQKLGGASVQPIEQALSIKLLSDIYFEFSIIPEIINNSYVEENKIEFQLPVSSPADNFNAFIAESTAGDYIEFYATWNDLIIGNYMGDIESGRIKLYTSNNPNDNFEEFDDTYGTGANKWVVMHEIYVYEHIPGNTILTQQYVFTQDQDFISPNYFRPVIKYSDLIATYTIDYICRLTNRMDGTQIIRKASFASTDPKKYGKTLQQLNMNNLQSYKIFNRIEGEASPNIAMSNKVETKFVKVFYDTTKILLNMDNVVQVQGTGPLYLKQTDGVYKFTFDKVDENNSNELINVDLSGAYQYALIFKLDNDTKIEIEPTFSQNMNLVLGEIEFKITEEQVDKLMKQQNSNYSIVIKNADNTTYTFYQGIFYPYDKNK